MIKILTESSFLTRLYFLIEIHLSLNLIDNHQRFNDKLVFSEICLEEYRRSKTHTLHNYLI